MAKPLSIAIALLAAALPFAGGSEQSIMPHSAADGKSPLPTAAMPIAAAATALPSSAPTSGAMPSTYRQTLGLEQKGAYVISRSADGLFYVDAMIGKNSIRFLVDTGANVTVLTRTDAERLGLSAAGAARATMQTAGGPTSMQWTKIPLMNVANKPVENVNAAIIDKGIQVSLLGQNVLSRMEGMTFTGDQLRFH